MVEIDRDNEASVNVVQKKILSIMRDGQEILRTNYLSLVGNPSTIRNIPEARKIALFSNQRWVTGCDYLSNNMELFIAVNWSAVES